MDQATKKAKHGFFILYINGVLCPRKGGGSCLEARESEFSSQAIHSARNFFPGESFKEVNYVLQRGPREPRVYATDESKVHVHPYFLNSGYKTRTNDKPVKRPAKRP